MTQRKGNSEALNSNQIELAMAYQNMIVQRNNIGVAVDLTGRHIRYGLMNSSKQENERFKSSDWICGTPVLITPQMVGTVVGVYTAIETKADDWKFSENDKHTMAQHRYHELIRGIGGYAGFAQSPLDMLRIIKRL